MCVCADDPQADKLVLVMEYAEAGPVMRGDRSTEKVPLAEGVALKFFRDVLQVGMLAGFAFSITSFQQLLCTPQKCMFALCIGCKRAVTYN